MGLFKKLFSMPKVIEAAINAGDALVFTDEERKQWVLESAKVLGPQTLSRRYIALIVTGIWAALTVIQTVALIMAHPQATALLELYAKVFLAFGGVMGFYFGIQFKR